MVLMHLPADAPSDEVYAALLPDRVVLAKEMR